MTTEEMIRRELTFRHRLRAPFRWLAYFVAGFWALSILLFVLGKILATL